MNEHNALKKVSDELKNLHFSSFDEFIKNLERILNTNMFFPEEKKNKKEPVFLIHFPKAHFLERFKARKIRASELLKTLIHGYFKNKNTIEKIIKNGQINKKIIFQYKNIIIPVISSPFIYCKKTYEKNPYACITHNGKIYPKMRFVAKTIYKKGIPDDYSLIKEVKKILKENLKIIGLNKKSAVFLHENKNYAVKIFENSENYEFILEYVKNKKNLAVPRIVKGPEKINRNYSIVVFEKTKYLDKNETERILEKLINGNLDNENMKNLFETLKELMIISKIFNEELYLNSIHFVKNDEGKILISDNIFQFPAKTSGLP